MNESELRRRELLRQTRRLYNDHNEIPAVHPRYGSICSSLYGDGQADRQSETARSGSFLIRLVIGNRVKIIGGCSVLRIHRRNNRKYRKISGKLSGKTLDGFCFPCYDT